MVGGEEVPMPENGSIDRLTAACAELDPPLAALDLAALWRNVDRLVRRAGGTPIRVASKSVRCRWVLQNVLARPGFAGLMCYSLAEACWLAREGFSDLLLGYPTADAAARAGRRPAAVGDSVWFRHAKAGELLERFDQVQLVEQAADGTVSRRTVPSYRGEGKNFG
jgi:D-serine deaminase-like pyridoxal phosphate-dependent protein